MKYKILVISISIFIIGCKRKSGQEYASELAAINAFSLDYASTQSHYQKSLLIAEENTWSDYNTIEGITHDINILMKHKNEYPQKAPDYDKLIEFYKKWPMRISTGTIYKDDCTEEIVKENIQGFKWVTYGDYLSNKYPEYKLDTIHIGWREIKNKKYGIDLWLPLTHYIQEKDNDSSLSFHLERVDTITGRYYVPYYKSVIEILIFNSKTDFDKIANRYGFEKQDTLWRFPSLSEECGYVNIDGSGSEEQVFNNIDSSGRTLTVSKDLVFPIPIEDDTLISLLSKDITAKNRIYMYIRQRESKSHEHCCSGEVFFCIINSFSLLKESH